MIRFRRAGFFAVLAAVSGCHVTRTRPETTPSVRLGLEDAPRVGRVAPPLVLRYATAQAVGAADQPFELGKELGNVVVIAFYPGDRAPESATWWRTLRERGDSLFGGGVVVVGVSADSLASQQRFAQELELPYKLLSDLDLRAARRYAATDGNRIQRTVVVVGRDGRVRYVDPRFAVLDPQSYVHLATAIAAAKERP